MNAKTDFEKRKESHRRNLLSQIPRLVSSSSSPDDYRRWLRRGLRNIFWEDDPRARAEAFHFFEFIIGDDSSSEVMDDLVFVYRNLSEDHRFLMRQGIVGFFGENESYPKANLPRENERENEAEIVALHYMDLVVKLLEPGEIFLILNHLVKQVFPRSQSIFDRSLIVFRLEAKPSLLGEWVDLFCSSNPAPDSRWLSRYSPLLAFGMCNISPDRARFYLEEWEPLQGYLHFLRDGNIDDSIFPTTFVEITEKIEEAKKIYGL